MNKKTDHTLREPFECLRCSDCCNGEGGIYLEKNQLPAAARELGMEPDQFIARHLAEDNGRFKVKSRQDGFCTLLGPTGCIIHKAKPEICRRWPFFSALLKDPGAFEEAKLACPGIDPNANHEDFVAYARREMQKEKPKQ